MVKRVISCGTNNIELGALDFALKVGIHCGGWTPIDKASQAAVLEKKYGLRKTDRMGFQQAVALNVSDADGTLIVNKGNKDTKTRYAVEMALKYERQVLNVDLSRHALFEAASLVSSWISMQTIRIVFVIGPGSADESDKSLYDQTKKLLETAFYLGFVKSPYNTDKSALSVDLSDNRSKAYPKTVMQAVNALVSVLSLKDKTILANMQSVELNRLGDGLGEYIKQQYGLYADNTPLMKDCAKIGGLVDPIAHEACTVIIRVLWEELRKTHKLRVVK